MAEYIDREAFKKSVEERYCKQCKAEGKDHNGCLCRACWVDDMLDDVECFKTADVVPVVHGRWMPFHSEAAGDIQYCSICGIGFDAKTDYCPHCGAKMGIKDGGNNDAESID